MTVHRFDRNRRRLRTGTPRPIAHPGGPTRAGPAWRTRAAAILVCLMFGWLAWRVAAELLLPRPLPVIVNRGTAVADLDCSDFETRLQVLRFMSRHGGAAGRHGLDGDGDGLACEWLPWLTLW